MYHLSSYTVLLNMRVSKDYTRIDSLELGLAVADKLASKLSLIFRPSHVFQCFSRENYGHAKTLKNMGRSGYEAI